MCNSIYNDLQRLTSRRKLKKAEVVLRTGNGVRVVVALGSIDLELPYTDFLYLKECYYVRYIVKNIISIFYLDKMRYASTFNNKCCSLYFESQLVATASLVNGVYLIDISSYNIQVVAALKKSKQSVNEFDAIRKPRSQ